MKIKLIGKTNIGVFITLILILLLSQSKIFNFLIDYALGRFILIFFILGISYTNKIIGVISVLFIIIIFNQTKIGYFENFDTKSSSQPLPQIIPTTPTTSSLKTNKTTTGSKTPNKKNINISKEGFNIIDRESNIQKGKQSNSVPVLPNVRNQNEDVGAYDSSVFTNSFSSFV